jgi:hypothetical protein
MPEFVTAYLSYIWTKDGCGEGYGMSMPRDIGAIGWRDAPITGSVESGWVAMCTILAVIPPIT